MAEEFWLHVREDGHEERYDHDPAPIRAVRVVVTDGFEETWTSDRLVRAGWQEPAAPPGEGWVATGGTGGSTLWRRRRPGT
jgi:MYXO-CTERM domain-containing protein